MMRIRLISAGLLALACCGSLAAREQIPAEGRMLGYSAQLPGCDDPAVLATVQQRFAAKEAEYWRSSLEIVAIEKMRAIAFRPNGQDLIPRRYCTARAHLSNHKTSPLYYSVVEDAGMAGYGFGVHFCVTAYDRNWANAPECKMARP